MIIKYPALPSQLQQSLKAFYILVGQDNYLLNDAALRIKQAWRQQKDNTDEQVIHLNTPNDWTLLFEEANSYSLFAAHSLLDAHFEKKTIDRSGKEAIQQYLNKINTRCLIILRAANLPIKQLQWLTKNESALIVQAAPFNASALQNWISMQLKHYGILYEPQIPKLIHQFTQGNMLGCAQAIEKLTLIYNQNETLTVDTTLEQLIDQCDYQLYELVDACLAANVNKVIHLLRQAANNRTEPTLILWLLTQEIRQLIELQHLLSQSTPILMACEQLKIWNSRAQLYQSVLSRFSRSQLYTLLRASKTLDERIKSNKTGQIWQSLEKLALSLCVSSSKIMMPV